MLRVTVEKMASRGIAIAPAFIYRETFEGCENKEMQKLEKIQDPVILVARDLQPSDVVKINPEYIKGIIIQNGGATSHISIMVKNYGIPVLTGVSGILARVDTGEEICMDAGAGIIYIRPDSEIKAVYDKKRLAQEEEREQVKKYRQKELVFADGRRVSLCANAGSAGEIKRALEENVDGIGLFRTEFLYLEGVDFPTEAEQFEVYREAVELSPNKVSIRTLDLGGDRDLPYYHFPVEENPFLGWRAIRISLDMPEMFRTQIRAILRASVFGHIQVMLPMLISVEELRRAKGLIEECKAQLRKENVSFDENIEVGMMMETPSSVLLAEDFAKEADFFSIGTNDLTQYLLAVDRGNKKIASRYDPFHPAVIKAIEMIIKAGHKHNIKVSMCGEMAGDVRAIPMLLEMGLDEFSMSINNVDYVRKAILGEIAKEKK